MNNTTHTFKCKQLVVATIAITIIILFQSCSAEKYMKRGERYLAIGEYYEAAAEFKTAYNKTPPKDKALRGERAQRLALCYERINSTQKAIAACRNAIRYGKGTPEIHLTLAQKKKKNGSYNEAEKEFKIRKGPDVLKAYDLLMKYEDMVDKYIGQLDTSFENMTLGD